ncbi:MAG: suppressor of fused domain protein [Patescibacteria group bacterium]|nr:suppressor of fused domain protein [Patescibacteria group bacterium]
MGCRTNVRQKPEGQEEYQYAELMMYLPADWPIQPKVDSPQLWPWRWLRTMAHYPHEQNTWLGGPLTTFANGEPPEPLESGCDFTAFLLAYELNFPSFESLDGRLIKIITAMPIYTEELRLAQQEDGFTKLLLRLQEEGITPTLKPNRPNVAL